jgi:hypothetical protein
MASLEDAYTKVHDMHEAVSQVEMAIFEKEELYDAKLAELAEIVGGANIPPEMLEYSKNVLPIAGEDGYSWRLVWCENPQEESEDE